MGSSTRISIAAAIVLALTIVGKGKKYTLKFVLSGRSVKSAGRAIKAQVR